MCTDSTSFCYYNRSYCEKHSKEMKSAAKNEKSVEERRNLRLKKIEETEQEFYTMVNCEVSS